MRDSRVEFEAVWWFSKQMLKKLKLHNHKDHWSGMSDDQLLDRLMDEVKELEHELVNGGDPKDIAYEAADIANFAMMIADNARRKS
jgi:hypothetical protein